MATVHNLSVLTNSCVKSPINPNTGLSQTIDEREPATLSSEWYGRDADFFDNPVNYNLNPFSGGRSRRTGSQRQSPRQSRSSRMEMLSITKNGDHSADGAVLRADEYSLRQRAFETSGDDLRSMPDEEFFQKLTKLRTEHRKTLDVYAKLYNDKLAEPETAKLHQSNEAKSKSTHSRSKTLNETIDDADINYKRVSFKASAYDGHMSKSVDTCTEFFHRPLASESDNIFQARMNYRTPVDMVKDMSSAKPPTGRQKAAPCRSTSPTFSNTLPKKSGKENLWNVSVDSSDAETDDDRDDQGSVKSCDDGGSQAVSRIQDMWSNFSVDDYAPIKRGRSSSLSLQEPADDKKVKEWQNRITVPKPFKMTLRDENKMKSTTMLDLEVELEERKQREESETLKQFKARPVPAHVYIPLYDELMEAEETKRRQNKMHCQVMLKSSERPFKFMKRETDKRTCRSQSMPLTKVDTNLEKFKARPFPEHIFDEKVADKIMEEEQYRRIRMQMRSEQLLRSSSLPPNMTARGKDYTAGKSRQKMYAERARKAGLTAEHRFRPKINGTVPEFDDVHRQFRNEMKHAKQTRSATVCRPFKMRTSRTQHDDEKDRHAQTDLRPRRPLRGSNNYRAESRYSMNDAMPLKMTAATQLRASATQSRLQRSLELEEEEQEALRYRRATDRRLKKQIAQRAEANDGSVALKRSARDKLCEYKRTERMREEEYQRELDEIRGRVRQRPLLFERASQTNAQQAAERKYKETVIRAGLDEDFIVKKGSGSRVRVNSHLSNGSERPASLGSRKYSHSTSERQYSEEYDDEAGSDCDTNSVSSHYKD